MKKREGFPEALYDYYDQLVGLALEHGETVEFTQETVVLLYLLEEAPLGRLREADAILAELVVVARQAVAAVTGHLLGQVNETGGVPEAQA